MATNQAVPGLPAAGASVPTAAASRPAATQQSEALVAIDYYTDPLCPWSWALEPQWRRLRYEFGAQVTWRYHMGGMLPDWQTFSDPLNSVSNPGQMGLQWFQVRTQSGMPIDERIWHHDPPESSFPACLAVKAAERQGADCAERYLRRLREAVMLERRNIAREEILLDLARELDAGHESATLDAERFAHDLHRPETLDAFREDVKLATYRGIGRFPTLTLRHVRGVGVIIVGYRPYEALRQALGGLAPELAPVTNAAAAVEYVAHWGSITARETAEALGVAPPLAAEALEAAVAAEALTVTATGPDPAGRLYQARSTMEKPDVAASTSGRRCNTE